MESLSSRRFALTGAAALLLAAVLILALSGGARGVSAPVVGEIGPAFQSTGNGHTLKPAGRLTTLGDFPDGSAVTPDGKYAWVVDCGHGKDDARIIDVATGKELQLLPLPGCYGGVAIAPDGRHAYVSGEPLGEPLTKNSFSGEPPAKNPTYGPTKGDSGDVVHIFSIDPATGQATEQNPLTLTPEMDGSGHTNTLIPVTGSADGPEGLAVSPDGKYLVVAFNVADRADVITLADNSQKVVSVGAYPEGVAFDPQGRAYVSNEYDGTISVIDPAAAKVTATISGLGGKLGDLGSHPQGMAADPKRPLLYVAVDARDLVDVVDTKTDKVVNAISVAHANAPGQALGTQPTSVAVSPDDQTLFASDAGEDALAAISLAPRPAAAPHGKPFFVRPTLAQIRAAFRRHGSHRIVLRTRVACSGPTRAQINRYIRRVRQIYRGRPKFYRARLLAAIRAVPFFHACPAANFIPNLPAYTLIGRIPTAAYPDSVVTSSTGQLIYTSGKGFGSGPNPLYPFDGAKSQGVTPQNTYGTYVLDILIGRLGVLPSPTDREIQGFTPQADAQGKPDNDTAAPAGSPVPGVFGQPSTKIKHIFYIVRENRTYDQVFGSMGPKADGDPSLELFDDNGVTGPTGGITPNQHALTRRFPLLDHFYEDSEVSLDGHLITAGGVANDYSQKAIAANYSGRRGTFDSGIYPVTFGPRFFLFDQAAAQGVSFTVYGELFGTGSQGVAPNRPQAATVASKVYQPYPNDLLFGCLQAGVVASCTQDSGTFDNTGKVFAGQSRFNTFYPEFQRELATNSVPTINYMILPNDHTQGTRSGDFTPQAMVADNDLAIGQIVDAISHSSIWDSSAILIDEDDSQDGADHVDSHRSPAFVISPWASTGVVSTRYDQYSVLATVERLAGLQPLNLNDALATPMYDAFISGDQKPNNAPYTAINPTYPIDAKNTAAAANARLSNRLPWNQMDAVPQRVSDRILWQAVYGAHSTPPPPGPNADPEPAVGADAAGRR